MSCEVISQPLFQNEHCQKILKRYTQEKFTLIDYEVKRFSESVLGFLSEHLVLAIKYKTGDCEWIRKANFFVKSLPQSNGFQSELIKEMAIFNKEVKIFKNLLTDFSRLSSRSFAPKCYLSQEDKFIVLEDLRENGYHISETSYLTYDQMVSLMKTLASFHAASIVYEENRSRTNCEYHLLENFQEELQESTFSFVDGHPRNKWCITVEKCISDCIKLQKKYTDNEELHRNLKRVMFEKMPEYIKSSRIFRNVVNHDDLWGNNLMFNSQHKCVIVDFQLARYVPAAYDVLMALYLNTGREFLENNLNIFLNVYYDTLTTELRVHQVDVDRIYTKKEFSESIGVYRLPALLESVMFGTIIYLPQELSKSIVTEPAVFQEFMFENRSKYVTHEYLQNETFRNRLDDVLYPLIELLDNYTD